jgi:predicted HAD superfamily Cof-like phosphohydrolase
MSSKTNFEKVIEFNRAFGCKMYEKCDKSNLDDSKLVELRKSLILEEVKELCEALETKSMSETIDALADILYVVYGCGAALGINLDQAYDIVHKSNMTKLCETEDVAKETVEWYKQHEKRYDSPDYRKSDDGRYWIVYNKSTVKILKNKYYVEANFDKMMN